MLPLDNITLFIYLFFFYQAKIDFLVHLKSQKGKNVDSIIFFIAFKGI